MRMRIVLFSIDCYNIQICYYACSNKQPLTTMHVRTSNHWQQFLLCLEVVFIAFVFSARANACIVGLGKFICIAFRWRFFEAKYFPLLCCILLGHLCDWERLHFSLLFYIQSGRVLCLYIWQCFYQFYLLIVLIFMLSRERCERTTAIVHVVVSVTIAKEDFFEAHIYWKN